MQVGFLVLHRGVHLQLGLAKVAPSQLHVAHDAGVANAESAVCKLRKVAISNSNPSCLIVRNVPTLTRIKIVKTSKEAKLSYLTVLRIGIVKPTAKHVDCEGQFEFSIIRIFAYRTPKILALLWLSPVEGHRSPLWLHPK